VLFILEYSAMWAQFLFAWASAPSPGFQCQVVRRDFESGYRETLILSLQFQRDGTFHELLNSDSSAESTLWIWCVLSFWGGQTRSNLFNPLWCGSAGLFSHWRDRNQCTHFRCILHRASFIYKRWHFLMHIQGLMHLILLFLRSLTTRIKMCLLHSKLTFWLDFFAQMGAK
jgi:hypothetical protein